MCFGSKIFRANVTFVLGTVRISYHHRWIRLAKILILAFGDNDFQFWSFFSCRIKLDLAKTKMTVLASLIEWYTYELLILPSLIVGLTLKLFGFSNFHALSNFCSRKSQNFLVPPLDPPRQATHFGLYRFQFQFWSFF